MVRTPSTSRGSTSATMKVRLPISCFIGWSSRRSTKDSLDRKRRLRHVECSRCGSVRGWVFRVSSQTASGATGIDGYFKITERGSTLSREIRGGLVTFFTMGYIVVLNPLILGFAADADGKFLGGGPGDGSNLPAIAAGTALVAGVLTILMGVVANYPLALAAGLGLNAFVAFAIASQMSWADAMGLVVIEGVIILVLVLTGFRTAVFHAVPTSLKTAISVGIGLFIALIGFVDAGFVAPHPRRRQHSRCPCSWARRAC